VGGPYAIKKAIKKFGKKAVQKATDKMTYIGKEISKKSKSFKDTKIAKESAKIQEKLNLPNKPPFHKRLEKGGSVKKYAGGSVVRKPKY
jgi:transposase-like protein